MHCDHLRMSSGRAQPSVPQVAVDRIGLAEISRTAATDGRVSSIGVIVADDHTMFRQGLIALLQVGTYRQRLMDKLGLHSLADVVRHAVQAALLEGGSLASFARNNLERIDRRVSN